MTEFLSISPDGYMSRKNGTAPWPHPKQFVLLQKIPDKAPRPITPPPITQQVPQHKSKTSLPEATRLSPKVVTLRRKNPVPPPSEVLPLPVSPDTMLTITPNSLKTQLKPSPSHQHRRSCQTKRSKRYKDRQSKRTLTEPPFTPPPPAPAESQKISHLDVDAPPFVPPPAD